VNVDSASRSGCNSGLGILQGHSRDAPVDGMRVLHLWSIAAGEGRDSTRIMQAAHTALAADNDTPNAAPEFAATGYIVAQ